MAEKQLFDGAVVPCDHTSVGVLVWKGASLLLIERKRPPFGFAPPAGHVDNDLSFEHAAVRELLEETGLLAVSLHLMLEQRKDNHCRRPGGTWHLWKVYRAAVVGDLAPNPDETSSIGWFSVDALHDLARQSAKLLAEDQGASGWHSNPGVEPVWCELLAQLGIL